MKSEDNIKDIARNFYLNGCMLGEWKQTPTYNKFMKCLNDIYSENLKDGFTLKQKYPYSNDVRPAAWEYDDSFIDILFENNIHNIIKKVVSANVVLSHIQVRNVTSFPDKKTSYMEWHRDSYNYNNKPVGSIPPGYKINFYPNFGEESENVLSVVPGSHIKLFSNPKEDLAQITPDNTVSINNSDTQFLLFNVGLLHSTGPAKVKNNRIIFNFNHECFIDEYSDQKGCADKWREGCIKNA